MPTLTPPPRQKVLNVMQVQAEQAHALVEDLQAGSLTASVELMDLAGQLAARARMYKWTRVTSWATKLEDRLAKGSRAGQLKPDDILWLDIHVHHLDEILEDPTGVSGGIEEDARFTDESVDIDLEIDDGDFAGGDSAGDDISIEPLSDEESAAIAAALEGLEDDPEEPMIEEPAESLPPPMGASPEPFIASVPVGGFTLPRPAGVPLPPPVPPDVRRELPSPPPEAPLVETEMDVKEPEISEESTQRDTPPAPEPDMEESTAETEPVPEELAPITEETPAVPEAEAPAQETPAQELTEAEPPAPVEAELTAPVEAESPPPEEGSATEAEAAAQSGAVLAKIEIKRGTLSQATEAEGSAVLAKLDIQRVAAPSPSTHTELQGPHQYVVVSVSDDPEVHMWLGKMLPERRFEMCAARGSEEAEALCRDHQPDLMLLSWDPSNVTLAQQTLERIRANPLTSYVRFALVIDESSLASQLAATRMGAACIIPRSASPKDVFSKVQLAILAPSDVGDEELGETSMSELSELLLDEVRAELDGLRASMDVDVVSVNSSSGVVLRETLRQFREGLHQAFGHDPAVATEEPQFPDELVRQILQSKRALVLEADRVRRAELARVLGEIGIEVLPPQSDLSKALEAGLTWAPDVLVGGAPREDSITAIQILRRDVALSSMQSVLVDWPKSNREWPDPRADMATLQPRLRQQLIQAFSPITNLIQRLAAPGQVKGRVESCGMFALIRYVTHFRPQSMLKVSEGTDQIEIWINEGRILDARWIEGDGTETLHMEAFFRTLTVARGKFEVLEIDAAPSPALPETFGELLAEACRWWRPLSLTIDRRLEYIQPLKLDLRRATELKRQTGKTYRRVVAALAKGSSPSDVIASGVDPSIVAHTMRELVRRFAIKDLPVPTQ